MGCIEIKCRSHMTRYETISLHDIMTHRQNVFSTNFIMTAQPYHWWLCHCNIASSVNITAICDMPPLIDYHCRLKPGVNIALITVLLGTAIYGCQYFSRKLTTTPHTTQEIKQITDNRAHFPAMSKYDFTPVCLWLRKYTVHSKLAPSNRSIAIERYSRMRPQNVLILMQTCFYIAVIWSSWMTEPIMVPQKRILKSTVSICCQTLQMPCGSSRSSFLLSCAARCLMGCTEHCRASTAHLTFSEQCFWSPFIGSSIPWAHETCWFWLINGKWGN